MRRPILGLAAALAIVLLAPAGQAFGQVGGLGNDPFSLYYGWYLPNAMYQAAQPTPMDSINQMTMRRQATAQTDRTGLYDPLTPFGEDELDPLSPYGARQAATRTARHANTPYTAYSDSRSGAAKGHGANMYFNRTARYHPDLKIGRGPNRNIAALRGRPAGGMGGGMGGMPAMPTPPTPPR